MALREWITGMTVAVTAVSSAQYYSVTVIDGLPTAIATGARGINDNGHIIGYSLMPNQEYRSFVYADGETTDLGSLGGSTTLATDINNSGVVVGRSRDSSNNYQAFAWTSMHGIRPLTVGAYSAVANGLNDKGHIVGEIRSSPSYSSKAFLLRNGRFEFLPTPYSHNYSAALAINNQGIIVGRNLPDQTQWAIPLRWVNGVVEVMPGGDSLWPASINSSGQVAGYRWPFYPNTEEPVAWIDGQFVDLPSRVGRGACFDVSNSGVMVGWILDRNWLNAHACLWRDGKLVILDSVAAPSRLSRLASANGIDSHGRIVGNGILHGRSVGILLTPIGDGR